MPIPMDQVIRSLNITPLVVLLKLALHITYDTALGLFRIDKLTIYFHLLRPKLQKIYSRPDVAIFCCDQRPHFIKVLESLLSRHNLLNELFCLLR